VIIADTRSSMVAAKVAAAVGCVFDVDFDPMLAQRALLDGALGTQLNSARSAWEVLCYFGRASAYQCGVAETPLNSAR
jgi:hypothetical protein